MDLKEESEVSLASGSSHPRKIPKNLIKNSPDRYTRNYISFESYINFGNLRKSLIPNESGLERRVRSVSGVWVESLLDFLLPEKDSPSSKI